MDNLKKLYFLRNLSHNNLRRKQAQIAQNFSLLESLSRS